MAEQVKKTKLPPTLIVGLGGTGCEIASRVYNLSNEEQRKYIRFAYFDTDANELRQHKERNPEAYIIQTSKRLTVGQALRNDREARESSFPTNMQLLGKPLTEGAGQVRAISKLAFDSCIREGRMTALHDAINDLQKLNGDDMEQVMRVVIISTLVGGTGSGILLPVSMYIRNYLENACQKKPLVRGFCVLPDVFFHNNKKSETEKNNLRANAYATLRELDAFMLKADSTQSKEISDRYWLKMPRPGTSDEYDEYTVSPLDFCFLFDGQNMDGDGLQNFESYKQHCADCIYASSVSLMNKRLNSSEDNTILERCAENGRNRYCGIGTSKIIYPYEKVRDYIAMKWMDQSMNDEWLRYDKEIARLKKNALEDRAKGVFEKDINEREEYCKLVENNAEQGNKFSLFIREECYTRKKSDNSIDAPKWEKYYEKLQDFSVDQSDVDGAYTEGIPDKIQDKLNILSALKNDVTDNKVRQFKSNFQVLVSLMKIYFSKAKRHAEDNARSIANGIFSIYNFNPAREERIEHWLINDGKPLHPNAARFFVYSIETKLKEELRRLTTASDQEDRNIENDGQNEAAGMNFADLEKWFKEFFEVKDYTVKNGDSDTYATIEASVRSLSLKGKFGGNKNGDEKEPLAQKMHKIIEDCIEYKESVELFHSQYLKVAIIKQALEYLNKLGSSYEFFFEKLEDEIKRIPRRIARTEEMFVNDTGDPIIYACASAKCIKGLAERCPNGVDPVELTPEFRQSIFDNIFKTVENDDKEQQRKRINKLVSEDILDFWRHEVIGHYGSKVDMDIIDALRTEAEIEENQYSYEEQKRYVEKKHSEALKLAAPFIDKPIGREPYIIYACVMNTKVATPDDMQKSDIVHKVFNEREKDPLMEKNQILFMKALYNLRVSDLPKFAPADNNPVDPHKEGDYYKAYWNRIDSIVPDSMTTKILTPHLDKRWHYIGIMPDLSEASEERCTAEAQEAFLVSIVYKFVKFSKDQYRFIDKNGDYIKDTIIVEDGRCNKLHEILEAMFMSRPLVLNVLERFNEIADKEANEKGLGNRKYEETSFYKGLEIANLCDVPDYADIPKISVFELPLLCKISKGNSMYNDDDSIVMLQNFMDFIEKYLTKFYRDEYARNEYFVQWVRDQALLMLDNVHKYYGKLMADPVNDSLVNRAVSVIIGRIGQYEVCQYSNDAIKVITDRNNEYAGVNEDAKIPAGV